MHIRVSAKDATPIYVQIVDQVRRLIASGELNEGDELPSIRALADQLVVNPNTVARAYRELEGLSLAAIRRGTSTYVAATSAEAEVERSAVVRNRVEALVSDARQMKLSLEDVVDLVTRRFEETEAGDDREVVRG